MKTENRTRTLIIIALAAGYAARMFLMATTYSGDLGYIYGPPLIWTEHGYFNVYAHMNAFGWDTSQMIYYPPGMLLISASFEKIISLIFPSFPTWVLLLREGDTAAAMADPARFYYLFLMKLPSLACDALLVKLLLRMRDRIPVGYTLFFWVLNPFVIHDLYMVGQFDSIVALPVCAAMYHYYSGRHQRVSVYLGIAAAIKTFPLIVVFCHALISGRSHGEKIRLLVIGGIIPLMLTLPFLIGGDFTVLRSYFASGVGVESTSGGGLVNLLLRMTPVAAVLAIILVRRKGYSDYLPRAAIALLFMLILTVRFEDRYVLWVIAPLMIYAAGGGTPRLWVILVVVFSNLSTFTYYGELVTQVFSPLAGGPVSTGWIADYCAGHGLPMPHKIFKILMKTAMVIITVKILFGGRAAAGGKTSPR